MLRGTCRVLRVMYCVVRYIDMSTGHTSYSNASQLTYGDYLHVPQLISLQHPQSSPPHHDELLFIITHQTYELWFKQLLHEVETARDAMAAGRLWWARHLLGRVAVIEGVLVHQIDVLETMTPSQFATFRARLDAASGFQSAQFREVEFVLGHKRTAAFEQFPPGSEARTRLESRFREPGLWDWFVHFLAGRKYAVPEEALNRDVTQPPAPSPDLQRTLVHIYRTDPAVAELCERLVDLDEGVQEWRYRHVKMVERTIGTRPGTGGSAGAEYLRTTLLRPVFTDLWAIRTEF